MFLISSFRSSFVWFLMSIFLAGCALLKYEKYIFQGGDYAECYWRRMNPIRQSVLSYLHPVLIAMNSNMLELCFTIKYFAMMVFLVQCKNIIHCVIKKILLCFIEFLHIQLFKFKLLHRIIRREAVVCAAQ